MGNRWRGFVFGILLSAILFSVSGTAAATVGDRTIAIAYRNIKVTLDGNTVDLVDVDGNPAEPFLSNGTTYLPVRAIATALGLDVAWNNATSTVELSTPNKTDQVIAMQPQYNGERHMLSPGQVFDAGGYIELEGVEFLYDGEKFLITNNREDIVMNTYNIVGVKVDGTHVSLQSGALRGVDRTQYEKDLKENGWAVEQYTNYIRPGETLAAELSIFNFGYDADVDGDGYYDIKFSISPQESMDSLRVSTGDPESDVYKFRATGK